MPDLPCYCITSRCQLSYTYMLEIMIALLCVIYGGPQAVDKTRNTEHSGTSRNIPEHEKIKIIVMKKNNIIIIIK